MRSNGRTTRCFDARSLTRGVIAVLLGTWASAAAAQQAPEDDEAWGDEASDAVGFGLPDKTEQAEQAHDEADAIGFGDDEEAWGGDDEAGFAEPDAGAAGLDTAPPHTPSPLSLTGFVRTREALWVERFSGHPLAKARQSLDLELRYKRRFGELMVRLLGQIHGEYDAAYLFDRERFDRETLDAYEWQVIGGESFVALSYKALELTLGRQIVALGQGELLSPLDVVNPRDLREPGLAELDDIRLAVLASRLGVFVGSHRFEAMVIHEASFGLLPPPLSDFSPTRSLLGGGDGSAPLGELHYVHKPQDRFSPEASQLVGRYSYKGPGVDLGLYAASILDRQGVPMLPTPADLERIETPLRLFHPRYTVLGHAGARPDGDFLWRWELGLELERPLAATDASLPTFNLRAIRRTQLRAMLGATYSGIEDGALSIEIAQPYVFDHPERAQGSTLELLSPAEQPTFAVRYSHDFLRETLQLTIVALAFGVTEYRGLLGRAEVSYELVDALSVGAGYVTYQPHGDFGPIFGFDEHDRFFTTLRWDFILL